MDTAGRSVSLGQTKADAVHAELKRRILDGTVPPASSLNQEQLALELGISTTPLREAIRRLASEGLVKYTAHRDVVVISIQEEDRVQIYEVKESLDSLAARLAAERHTPDEARRITDARDALLSHPSGDPLDLNRRFHRAIYTASHNPMLVEILEGLWDRADRHRRLLHAVARTPGVIDEHLALADAVLAHDRDLAAALMSRHVRQALDAMGDVAAVEVKS